MLDTSSSGVAEMTQRRVIIRVRPESERMWVLITTKLMEYVRPTEVRIIIYS